MNDSDVTAHVDTLKDAAFAVADDVEVGLLGSFLYDYLVRAEPEGVRRRGVKMNKAGKAIRKVRI